MTHNKIGVKGAECISKYFYGMKDIRVLDLSHCELTDSGLNEVVQEMDSCSLNLEEVNLSGNGMGKNVTYFNKYLD